MQYDLFGEKSRGCCTDSNAMSMFGPQWLMEGSAEYMGYALMADLGLIDLDKRMLEVASQIQPSDTSLKSRETRKGFRELSNSWDIGPVATHLLISQSGFAALAKFYSDLGEGKKMRPTFLEAFGRSTEQFDREFKDYIQSSPESTEAYLKDRPAK